MATLIKEVGEKYFKHKNPEKQQKVFKTHASVFLDSDEIKEWKAKRSSLHIRKTKLTNKQVKARKKSAAAKKARQAQR
jgi:septal ring factor EnvC (AmiA/AmiB activator)